MRIVGGQRRTEGAAGVAVAGYLAVRDRFADLSVAVVLCGANIDPRLLEEILGQPGA